MENLELYFENDACDIFYNTDLNAVQTQWKGTFVYGDKFRYILDKITELLIKKRSHIIIADAREMQIIDVYDREWILTSWYPRTSKAGFSLEVLIVKQGSINERSIKQVVQQYDERKVQTVYFYSYEEATQWINDNIKNFTH